MNYRSSILEANESRKPFFDGDDLDGSGFEFKCPECRNISTVGCKIIYKACWNWQEELGEFEAAKASKYFKLGSSKRPSQNWPWKDLNYARGWPTILFHNCDNCLNYYALLFEFNEYRNSAYKIIIQAIARVET